MRHPLSHLVVGDDAQIGAIGISDSQAARILSTVARVDAHDPSVQKAVKDHPDDPEVKEYAGRWSAAATEARAMGDEVGGVFHFEWESGVRALELKVNNLIREFNDGLLKLRIAVRKTTEDNEALRQAADVVKRRAAEPGQDFNVPAIKPSPATTAPVPGHTAPPDAPPEIPVAVKVAALFTLGATSVATTVAMKSDANRAVAAGAGAIVTFAAAVAMFWPVSTAPKESKK